MFFKDQNFHLSFINDGSYPIEGICVNCGLESELKMNVSIPADGSTYTIGYFKIFSNSNVEFKIQDEWQRVSNLGLPVQRNSKLTIRYRGGQTVYLSY